MKPVSGLKIWITNPLPLTSWLALAVNVTSSPLVAEESLEVNDTAHEAVRGVGVGGGGGVGSGVGGGVATGVGTAAGTGVGRTGTGVGRKAGLGVSPGTAKEGAGGTTTTVGNGTISAGD